MGCCGKQGGCKREQTLPTEALFNLPTELVGPLAAKLLGIAAAGLRANAVFRQFDFSNPELAALAKKIADLAIENEYLRTITDLSRPVAINTPSDNLGNLEIAFGPKNAYVLKIPITTAHNREKIVTQLRVAADNVSGSAASGPSAQKVFSFLGPEAPLTE